MQLHWTIVALHTAPLAFSALVNRHPKAPLSPGGLRGADSGGGHGRVRGRHQQERADARARPARLHAGRQAADRGRQQDGLHRAALPRGALRGDQEGGVVVHQEDW